MHVCVSVLFSLVFLTTGSGSGNVVFSIYFFCPPCALSPCIVRVHVLQVKMQTYAAVVSSLVLCVGALYWYKYCLRIYNR